MSKSSSDSVLSFIGTVVLGGLDLSEGRHGSVKILDSDIYRDLDVSETDIAFFFDITGTRVHGALKLEPPPMEEQAKADAANKGFRRYFSARNAHVRILVDTRDAWDRWSVLDLSGFEYDRLSSPSTTVQQRAENPYLRECRMVQGLVGIDGDLQSTALCPTECSASSGRTVRDRERHIVRREGAGTHRSIVDRWKTLVAGTTSPYHRLRRRIKSS